MNASFNVVQRTDYYPSGLPFSGGLKPEEQPFKYNDKEFDTMHGLNQYDFGARMLDPAIARFHVPDRFAEKYPHLSPYSFAAGNPLKFVDVNGDSINVAEQYRSNFNESLKSVFGEKASLFSFDKSGTLNTTATKKDFAKGSERKAFVALNKIMNDKTVTNVVYESSTELTTANGSSITLNTAEWGGAMTFLASENKHTGIKSNTILIDPNMSSTLTVFAVNDNYYNSGGVAMEGYSTSRVNVTTSVGNATWHELGHVRYEGKNQNKVLGFDNMVRSLNHLPIYVPTRAPGYDKGGSGYTKRVYSPSPLLPRPPDVTHNRLAR